MSQYGSFLVSGTGYREPFTIPNRAGVACHNMAPFLVLGPGYREPFTIPNRPQTVPAWRVTIWPRFWCWGQAIEDLPRFQIAPAWRVTIWPCFCCRGQVLENLSRFRTVHKPCRRGVSLYGPVFGVGPGYREPSTIPNRAGVACHDMVPFLVLGPGYREPSTIPNRAGVACHDMARFWCGGQAIENLSRFQIAPAWCVTIWFVFGVGARL